MSTLVKIPKYFEVLENVTFLIFFFLSFNLASEKEGEREKGGEAIFQSYKIITVFVSKLPFETIIMITSHILRRSFTPVSKLERLFPGDSIVTVSIILRLHYGFPSFSPSNI